MKKRNWILMFVVLLTTNVTFAAVQTVDSISITVSDLDKALDFYTNVLPFEKVSETEVTGEDLEHLEGVFGLRMRIARLRLGEEHIELKDYLVPEGRPFPIDSRSNDLWFQHIAIIVSDMDRAYQQLRKHKVAHASTGPQTLPAWNKNAGGIKAFYFKDPDGHVLEILQFPAGKGNPKWHKQRSGNPLFLGIDHTAIVVSDTDRSLNFYRDLLGLEVAGESENYGAEQERLNNVFGARLRITSLKPPDGPSIEFLEYLAPGPGRPVPDDLKANDLIHWQTRLKTPNIEELSKKAPPGKYRYVSSGLVELKQTELPFKKALVIRDPDGHAMQIVQE